MVPPAPLSFGRGADGEDNKGETLKAL